MRTLIEGQRASGTYELPNTHRDRNKSGEQEKVRERFTHSLLSTEEGKVKAQKARRGEGCSLSIKRRGA